jgi:hypothetical protein
MRELGAAESMCKIKKKSHETGKQARSPFYNGQATFAKFGLHTDNMKFNTYNEGLASTVDHRTSV